MLVKRITRDESYFNRHCEELSDEANQMNLTKNSEKSPTSTGGGSISHEMTMLYTKKWMQV